MASIQLFERASHASKYSKYRPTYPSFLFDLLLGYISRRGGSKDVALDVGCGSGQSTFQLGNHFCRCIGVDISSAQIHEAQEKAKRRATNNITFMVGKANEIPVKASTVDLVTIAQAWHWLPEPREFYKECKRVLKPNGCLAVYGYGNVHLESDSANAFVKDFYINTLKGCWHKERQHIDNEYSAVLLPFSGTERHDLIMHRVTSLSDFIGYVSSWSAYEKYCELKPNNTVLADLEAKIKVELAGEDVCSSDEVKVNMSFPLFINLGQYCEDH